MRSDNLKKRIARAKAADSAMTGVFYGVGGFFLLLLFVLAGYIIGKGFMGFYPGLLQFNKNGIGNQFFNTVYLVFLSLVISVPLGVAAGIYMAEYAKENRLTAFLRICIESLSSLPSIVVGLFGYLVFILMTGREMEPYGRGPGGFHTEPAFDYPNHRGRAACPCRRDTKRAAWRWGATHWRTIVKILLPACLPRIITGVILAAGRGFGEAAALLYTAGQSTVINWSNWNIASPTCALNPFRPGETLSLHIWVMRTEGSLNPNSAAIANFSAAVLVIMVLGFSLLARMMARRLKDRSGGQS